MANRLGQVLKPIGNIASSFSQYSRHLYNAPKDTITGIDDPGWYSPLQPTKPFAPAGTEPKGFQYWPGQNLMWQPRPDAEYTAADLKALATYPLARICIENVKDAITRLNWQIKLRRKQGETPKQLKDRQKGDPNISKLSNFLEYPDREHGWSEWIRPALDDLLTIDALSIHLRRTYSGDIVEIPVIRGEMIARYIDDNGYTPLPPSPAYAQNWWGMPLVNLTTDQLMYKPHNIVPRNTVSSQLYGMSATEQGAEEIKIGIQRLAFVLAYYTEGSVPGVVQVVPKSVSPEKIQEAMQWMNSDLAGDLAARRQWRMVQGFNEDGKPDQVIMAKEPLLADAFDDMHIRKICFQYGTSPQRLIKMIRTEGKSSNEAANIEGLLPWFTYVKGIHDFFIQRVLGFRDYEWVGDPFQEADPNKEAERLGNLVGKALMKPEEGREVLGLDPSGDPHADKLGVITGTGFLPLDSGVDLVASQAEKNRMPPAPPKDGPKPNGAAKAFEGISREEAIRVVNYLVKVANQPEQSGYGDIH